MFIKSTVVFFFILFGVAITSCDKKEEVDKSDYQETEDRLELTEKEQQRAWDEMMKVD